MASQAKSKVVNTKNPTTEENVLVVYDAGTNFADFLTIPINPNQISLFSLSLTLQHINLS